MASHLPALITADLEGVFIPEIWIAVAQTTGIDRLKLTTRDIADYDELMAYRMKILQEHNLTLADIQSVIAGMEPLPGAVDFIDWIRDLYPVYYFDGQLLPIRRAVHAQAGLSDHLCASTGYGSDGDDLRVPSSQRR